MTQSQHSFNQLLSSLRPEKMAALLPQGVRRTSVTLVASTLQTAGLIRYQRGHIRVINREGLMESACECYATIAAHADRLLGRRAEG